MYSFFWGSFGNSDRERARGMANWEDEMMFGIIGAGRIGKIHAANVAARRDCEVVFVRAVWNGDRDSAVPTGDGASVEGFGFRRRTRSHGRTQNR